jgi:hypothetical protein
MDLNPRRSAVIAVHLQNDIVTKGGAYGSFFAAQAASRDVIGVTGKVLDAARTAGATVLYTRVAWQPGYPDLVVNSPLLGMVIQSQCLVEGSKMPRSWRSWPPGTVTWWSPISVSAGFLAVSWTCCCALAVSTPWRSQAWQRTPRWRERPGRPPTWATARSSSPTRAAPPTMARTTRRSPHSGCWPRSPLALRSSMRWPGRRQAGERARRRRPDGHRGARHCLQDPPHPRWESDRGTQCLVR